MRPNRSCIWPTRRDLKGMYVCVNREDEDLIAVGGRGLGYEIVINRGEARLLARRLNQCLDGTVKK